MRRLRPSPQNHDWKPVSVDVREGKTILDTARRLGRVVQVGTQRRSTEHLIEAKKRYIDGGKLGAIGHIELCSYYHMRVRNAPPNEAPPAGLDWDMWCGPAPKLPFNKRIHPRGWRSFREFGNGIVGDMCIHMLDTVRWMHDLGRSLAFDPKTSRIIGDDDANKHLQRPYRAPWKHPAS